MTCLACAGTGFTPETGPVFPMFVGGIASLFLVTLPFASETPIGIDHPVSYLSLWATILLFFIWTAVRLAQQSMLPFPPQLGIGFWVALAGSGHPGQGRVRALRGAAAASLLVRAGYEGRLPSRQADRPTASASIAL